MRPVLVTAEEFALFTNILATQGLPEPLAPAWFGFKRCRLGASRHGDARGSKGGAEQACAPGSPSSRCLSWDVRIYRRCEPLSAAHKNSPPVDLEAGPGLVLDRGRGPGPGWAWQSRGKVGPAGGPARRREG